jgi:NAD(P)-dependent dehydrogenase (short-subunit alcohol dehydrogenase family)
MKPGGAVKMDLNNKIALITGASSGIGRATANLFAQKGAVVGVFGRNEEEVKEVLEEILAAGGKAESYLSDLTDADSTKAAIDKFGQKHGRIDVLFANAGINGVWAPLEELKVEEFDKTVAVNLRGSFITLKFVLPYMCKGGGSIIINSSVNGNRIFSNTGATAYSCTKAAQVAMTRMLAVELARFNIRVNAICPGAIDTPINEKTEKRKIEKAKIPVEFPQGQIPLTGKEPGAPEDCAELTLFLASEMSKHISGAEIYVDGAQSLLQG